MVDRNTLKVVITLEFPVDGPEMALHCRQVVHDAVAAINMESMTGRIETTFTGTIEFDNLPL